MRLHLQHRCYRASTTPGVVVLGIRNAITVAVRPAVVTAVVKNIDLIELHNGRAGRIHLHAQVARRSDRDVHFIVGAKHDTARPVAITGTVMVESLGSTDRFPRTIQLHAHDSSVLAM